MSIEHELRELRAEWPQTPDLAVAVRVRIEAEGAAPSGRRRGRLAGLVWRPQVAYGLATVLAAVAVLMAASPSARSAILEFLGLESARIERREPVATPRPQAAAPLGAGLRLGERVSLAEARAQLDFPVLVPSVLGQPDAVYIGAFGIAGDAAHLVYGPRPGIETSPDTGASVLIGQFRATVDPFIEKAAGAATRIVRFRIGGAPAYFLEGAHGFAFADPDTGDASYEEQRLAGNTLLVERDGLLLRVEGQVSQETAVAYIESLAGE
jgi:hypothetical protein